MLIRAEECIACHALRSKYQMARLKFFTMAWGDAMWHTVWFCADDQGCAFKALNYRTVQAR